MAKPLVPWIGGKRRLAKHIIPLFPNHQCYVEPFAGAAALFFIKEPSKTEILNDINGDLMNLYRVVKHHLEELHKQFKWVLISRAHWDQLEATPPETMTDIQRAAKFLYMQKLCFGGRVDGRTLGTDTTSRPRLNLFRLEQDLADAHFRLAGTFLESLSWEEVVLKYDRPHTLFYCDPPYWKTQGYGVKFPFDNYVRMAELARSISGKMIISINGHPDMRAIFEGLPVTEVPYRHGLQASRSKQVAEMIYRNWD